MRRVTHSLSALLPALLLAGCLQFGNDQRESGPKYELATLLSGQIRNCWYGSGSTGFSAYAAESDINPQFNRARILLLPKEDLEAKPLLVIEAVNKTSRRATVSAYGPLMQGAQGERITADLERWTSGSQACS